SISISLERRAAQGSADPRRDGRDILRGDVPLPGDDRTGDVRPRGPEGATPVVGQWRKWLERFKLHRYARRQPLVLINGLSEQSESWFRNLPYWRRYFDVYVPNILVYDGPGLHQRIDSGEPVSVEYLVEQLRLYLTNFVQTPP